MNVTINDKDITAVEAIKKNCAQNGFTVSMGDVIVTFCILYVSPLNNKRFDNNNSKKTISWCCVTYLSVLHGLLQVEEVQVSSGPLSNHQEKENNVIVSHDDANIILHQQQFNFMYVHFLHYCVIIYYYLFVIIFILPFASFLFNNLLDK